MNYLEREASNNDFDFLFELKKEAEYEAVLHVFGWDETFQRQLHEQEWKKAKPTVIESCGKKVGSYLFQPTEDGFYFGRFFLLQEFQGQGIGSSILKSCIAKAGQETIFLCYLHGNHVHSLYERHGFEVTCKDEHFVYMKYSANKKFNQVNR